MSAARDRLTSVASACALIDAAASIIHGVALGLARHLPQGHPATAAVEQLDADARVALRRVEDALRRVPNPKE